jgi:hypothetical protein
MVIAPFSAVPTQTEREQRHHSAAVGLTTSAQLA